MLSASELSWTTFAVSRLVALRMSTVPSPALVIRSLLTEGRNRTPWGVLGLSRFVRNFPDSGLPRRGNHLLTSPRTISPARRLHPCGLSGPDRGAAKLVELAKACSLRPEWYR